MTQQVQAELKNPLVSPFEITCETEAQEAVADALDRIWNLLAPGRLTESQQASISSGLSGVVGATPAEAVHQFVTYLLDRGLDDDEAHDYAHQINQLADQAAN